MHGILQHGGHRLQVFLHRRLADTMPAPGAFSQFCGQVFQRDRLDIAQPHPTDDGVDGLQHRAVPGEGGGAVTQLPRQPFLGKGLKGRVRVLAVAVAKFPLKLLGGVGGILRDTLCRDVLGHGYGLGLRDFAAVWSVSVADNELKFAFAFLFDTCHTISS